MTPEQKRIVIAEACGWREAFPKGSEPHPETKRGGILLPYVWVNEVSHARTSSLPDYFNDLNAMHEAEKVLPPLPYLYRLQEVCGGQMATTGDLAAIIKATAAQRAEAFLRTIGKWRDE